MSDRKLYTCLCHQEVLAQNLRHHLLTFHFGCDPRTLPGEYYCKTIRCNFHTESLSVIIKHCLEKKHTPKKVEHMADCMKDHILNLVSRVMENSKSVGSTVDKRPDARGLRTPISPTRHSVAEVEPVETIGDEFRRGTRKRKAKTVFDPNESLEILTAPETKTLGSEAAKHVPVVVEGIDDPPRRSRRSAAPKIGMNAGRGEVKNESAKKGDAEKSGGSSKRKGSESVNPAVKRSSQSEGKSSAVSTARKITEIRPFTCKECGFAPKMRNANERSALRSHVKRHMLSEMGQYMCTFKDYGCTYASNYISDAKKHLQKAHGIRDDVVPLRRRTEKEFTDMELEGMVLLCFGDI